MDKISINQNHVGRDTVQKHDVSHVTDPAPVHWPKVRQPLEERRAYYPAVTVPAASSLMGLLPEHRLPYLVFQVMELQGLGSVYVLE